MIQVNYFAHSYIGKRSSNEDTYLTFKLNDNSYFLAVADGMGGATSGQIASQTILKAAKEYLELIFAVDPAPTDLKNILWQTFQQCQKAISEAIQKNPDLSGMGTTLACVLICGNRFVTGNIGDSRVYKYSNNTLQQITEDHTFIQDYKNKEGQIPDKSLQAQYSHLLTRSIDGGKDQPDIFPLEENFDLLLPGMAFLICSDGLILNKTKTESEMFKEYLLGTKTLKTAAETLISNAYHSGSNDNITVALFEYGTIPRKKNEKIKQTYPSIKETQSLLKTTPTSITIKLLITLTIILFFIISAIIIKKSEINVYEKICKIVSEKDSTQKVDSLLEEKKEAITPKQKALEPPVIMDDRSSFPTKRNVPLSWYAVKLANDSLKFNIYFYYNSGTRPFLERKNQTSPIYLRDFPELKSGRTYYWKVEAVSKSGLTADSKLIKIIVQ